MPNFGLKCFLGSFIFSLLAVMAVTKGYFMLNEEQSSSASLEYKKVQNIELFAQNDESDRIYEKFKEISAPSQVQLPLSEQENEENFEAEDGYDDISDTLAFDGEQTGDIIYDPDEDEQAAPKNQSDEGKKELALNDEIIDEPLEKDENAKEDSDELEIADASEAPQFMIPLKHLFSTSSIGGTSVSAQTESGATALASQDIKVQADIKADDINDDPWDTVAVSNRYITKNKMAEFNNEHKKDLAALDEEKNSEAKAENETKVAYKMVKNILIPIPDEIMNDENLTPQLSYSDKNKKIDAKLKSEQDERERLKKEQEELARQAQKIDDKQSKSLSESITDWFAEGKSTEQKVNIISKDDTTNVARDAAATEKEESAFSKLLGLKKKNGAQNIIPSELKLAFQPNRAEISGQTLEWLRAFSENAVKDDEVMIEIRIDGSGSYELQQKRLNLLYTIFANNGVNYEKINIIFTARDPNSFIIRNVKYAVENNTAEAKNRQSRPWYQPQER